MYGVAGKCVGRPEKGQSLSAIFHVFMGLAEPVYIMIIIFIIIK